MVAENMYFVFSIRQQSFSLKRNGVYIIVVAALANIHHNKNADPYFSLFENFVFVGIFHPQILTE